MGIPPYAVEVVVEVDLALLLPAAVALWLLLLAVALWLALWLLLPLALLLPAAAAWPGAPQVASLHCAHWTHW